MYPQQFIARKNKRNFILDKHIIENSMKQQIQKNHILAVGLDEMQIKPKSVT